MFKKAKTNFIKKNILLQRNLELFLISYKSNKQHFKKTSFHLKQKAIKNLPKKTFFSSFKSQSKKQSLNFSQFSKKLYKPVQSSRLINKFQTHFEKTTFFPYKKPFMQFWIFPLFAGCYLSFFTFNQNYIVFNPLKHLFESRTPISQLISENPINLETNKSLDSFFQPHVFSKLSNSLPNSDLLFFSTYPINKVNQFQHRKVDKTLELLEFDSVCALYSKLTNTSQAFYADSAPVYLLENHLLQSLYFKKAMFNWIWYPLQSDLRVNSSNLTKKLSLKNSTIDHLFDKNLSPTSLQNFLNNPLVEYFRANTIFEHLLKDRVIQTSVGNAHFFSQPLEKLKHLESLPLVKSKMTNSILYFSLLLDQLNLTKQELSTKYNPFFYNQLDLELSNRNSISFSLSKNFQKKLKLYYDVHFLKILLKNYLKQVPIVLSTNDSTYLKKSLTPKVFTPSFVKKNLNQKSLTNRLTSILLSKTNQQNVLLKNEKQILLKKLQVLTNFKSQFLKTEVEFSSSLDSLILKNLFYNILVIQNWTQIFQLTNLNFPNFMSKQNSILFQNDTPIILDKIKKTNSVVRNLKPETTNRFNNNSLNLPGFKQIYLYNKLMGLSKSIINLTEGSLNSKTQDFQNEILNVQNPLLSTNVDVTKSLNNWPRETFSLISFFSQDKNSFLVPDSRRNSEIVIHPTRKQIGLQSFKTSLIKHGSNQIDLITEKSQNSEDTRHFIKQFFTRYSTNFKPMVSIESSFSSYPKTEVFSNLKKFNLLNSSKGHFESSTFLLDNNFLISSKANWLKKTNKVRFKVQALSFEKRKAEKIFRLYSSVKKSQKINLNKGSFSAFRVFDSDKLQQRNLQTIFPVLKKVKANVKNEILLNRYIQHSYYGNSLGVFKSFKSSRFNKASLKSQANLVRQPFFSEKMFLKQLGMIHFFKKSTRNFLNGTEKTYVEKIEVNEKKRRLKKLKLETRRRKKRKRFYPRPFYLRSHLYFSFLEKRHSLNFSKKLSSLSISSNLKEKKLNSFSLQFQSNNLTNKIYRQNRQKWGGFANNFNFFEPSSLKNFLAIVLKPYYHQQEFYRISNKTLTEFEKLSWKSYWLKLNLTPYISKIQMTLKQMKEIETFKSSKKLISTLLPQNLSFEEVATIKNLDQTKKVVPLYLNVNYLLQNTFLNPPAVTTFNTVKNKMEYESFLYDRITDEIKNVKSQLNLEGNLQTRSYKPGRQKTEKSEGTPFFHLLKQIQSLFDIQVDSRLQKTFLSTSLGDLPTLRVLWAFHKTNLFQVKENHFSKTLWEGYKNREKLKSNKTRKFISKVFQLNLGSQKRTDFQALSSKKIQGIEKKLQIFGQFIYKNKYEQYLRNLKFQFSNKVKVQSQLNSEIHKRTTYLDNISLTHYSKTPSLNSKQEFFHEKLWFNTLLLNKLHKPSLNFWWSTNQKSPLDIIFPKFLLDSSFSFQSLDSYLVSNKNSFNLNSETLELGSLNDEFTKSLVLTSFWISCCLFHIAILFSLLRIPEIRSLIKFQFLIFMKLTNIYLIGISSLYSLFQNYKTKLIFLLKKLQQFSFLSLKERKLVQINSKINNPKMVFYNEDFKDDSVTKQKFLNSMFNERILYQYQQKLKEVKKFNFSFQSTLNFTLWLRQFQNTKKSNSFSKSSKSNVHILKTQALYSISKKSKNLKLTQISSFKNFYSSRSQILWYNISSSLFSQKTFFIKPKNSLPKTLNLLESPTEFKKQVFQNAITKIQLSFSLSSLYVLKSGLSIFYLSSGLFYKLLFKIIDGIEAILLIFYKFLEKPAEVMVNWIAEFFLIEWSSSLLTYIPEIFDQQIWNSFFKFSRLIRLSNPIFSSFIIQRFFLNTFQIFYFWLSKQDMDLIIRQKKGIIFWDIWAEILIQAAEKYKMNLSSLSTVKEEQELLIENLVKDTSEEQNRKKSLTIVSDLNINLFSFSRFLNNYPSLLITNNSGTLNNSIEDKSLNFIKAHINSENFSLKSEEISVLSLFDSQSLTNLQKRWSATQYLTTQGRDTDLFMDIHPPKSFFQLNFLQNYVFSHELLASLTCEIYSGLFLQKISKNLLIIGPVGISKTFFIQALAGETELKIVTDNARRYSLVQGGVPVGMKLLRDVFDSIVLYSPCLFLLEDIHIIGERRPNLLSDDEILKSKDLTFGAEQDEVHEKNRMIYQVSRHSVSHYKRPYKGDFSFAIPTNHFCYDLFLGIQPPRKRSSDLTAKTPLPLVQIQKNLQDLDTSKLDYTIKPHKTLISLLQSSLEQYFAPPATSPFNILLLKEQKKLKPYKIVQQMPWSGLSYDQFILISKSNYSIRTKIALLAEIAMNSLTVKLDMITDLLVIVDSVRSNHGFVVFATTHLPSLLDPALRRPGRFDETIHLPNFPSLLSRFDIFKVNLVQYSDTVDFLDYSFANLELYKTNSQIEDFIAKTLSLLFNTKQMNSCLALKLPQCNFTDFFNDYPIYSLSQAFYTYLQSPLVNLNKNKYKKVLLTQQNLTQKLNKEKLEKKKTLKIFLNQNQFYSGFSSTNPSSYLALTYGQAGESLVQALINNDQMTYLVNRSINSFKTIDDTNDELNFKSFYYSKLQSKNYLLKLFSGKFSEFFVLTSFSQNQARFILLNNKQNTFQGKTEVVSGFVNKSTIKNSGQSFKNQDYWSSNLLALEKNSLHNTNFENIENFQTYWQSALIFLDSFFQKRYLYNKNSIVSKLLFFENFTQLRQPPSPPNSSILKPARQFENYKRTFKEFTEKPLLTINEKIKVHQNQRFLKVLYNVYIQRSFNSLSKESTSDIHSPKRQNVDFSNSFKELSYLDFLTLKPSSSYNFYKKNILSRQRFQFLNQWWNGQLPEHTVESTYLSHIDWRSMFIQSLGDFVIDFPDAEQYYNPKNRRWFLNSKSWSYWLDFEKIYKDDISNYLIFDSLITTYKVLDSNRELLDILAFAFLRNSKFKEIDFVSLLIRFYKTSQS